MKKSLLALFFIFIFFSSRVFAYDHEFIITDIVSDQNLQIERLDKQIEVLPGDILAIYSHQSNEVLGYAIVDSITDSSDLFMVTIESHHKNGLIRPENYLRKLDLTRLNNDIPARYDLAYKAGSNIASKYRPLVYAGLIQGMTATNLNKSEWIIGPSILAYGLTANSQLDINLASTLFGVLNLGLKNKLIDNDDYELAIENGFQYYPSTKKGSYQFTGYLDMASNSNFKSYAKFKLFTKKPEDQSISNNEEYSRDFNLELQLAYGYIFSNWNQMIFGPKVDVNKKHVGGVIGYYILDKNINTMFGVSSNDFSELRLGKQAYLLNLDLWWRF